MLRRITSSFVLAAILAVSCVMMFRVAAAQAPATEPTGPLKIPREWLRGNDEDRKRLQGMEGQNPPAMRVLNWVNIEPFAFEQERGKVILVDFWNPASGVSIAATSRNQAIFDKYKDQQFTMIAICKTSGKDNMSKVIAARKITYPCNLDEDNTTADRFKVQHFDSYYLIDKAGKLRIADCEPASVEDALKALIAEKIQQRGPSRSKTPTGGGASGG